MRSISKEKFRMIEKELYLYSISKSSIQKEIENVLKELPERKMQLVRVKYFSKNNKLTWLGVSLRLSLSRSQTFVWRDEIIHRIADEIQ